MGAHIAQAVQGNEIDVPKCDFPVIQALIDVAGYDSVIEALSIPELYSSLFGDFELDANNRATLLNIVQHHYAQCSECQAIAGLDRQLDDWIHCEMTAMNRQ